MKTRSATNAMNRNFIFVIFALILSGVIFYSFSPDNKEIYKENFKLASYDYDESQSLSDELSNELNTISRSLQSQHLAETIRKMMKQIQDISGTLLNLLDENEKELLENYSDDFSEKEKLMENGVENIMNDLKFKTLKASKFPNAVENAANALLVLNPNNASEIINKIKTTTTTQKTTATTEKTTTTTFFGTTPEQPCNLELWTIKLYCFVYVDAQNWLEVHRQYHQLLLKNPNFQNTRFHIFNTEDPTKKIDLVDVADIEIIKSTDLILLLNEHDFLNINHFFTQNKICEFKQTAEKSIICFREIATKTVSQPNAIENEYILVNSFTKDSKFIPKIEINGRWFNCGPEWINPILFRPKIFNNRFMPEVTEITTAEYVRYDLVMEFMNSEKKLDKDIYSLEMEELFPKIGDVEPPGLKHVPVQTCSNNTLLVLIKSGRNNHESRSVERSIKKVLQFKMTMQIQMFFLVGSSSTENDTVLLNEQKIFDDIVIGDFEDTYHNLPYKTFTGHHFVNSKFSENCDQAWVIFQDDDTFVNYLMIEKSIREIKYKDQDYICLFVKKKATDIRAPLRSGKWNINYSQFSYGYKYPGFCNGPCALFSTKASKEIFSEAKQRPTHDMFLEDVLFTGIFRLLSNNTNIIQHSPSACEHLKTRQALDTKLTSLIRQYGRWPDGTPSLNVIP